MAGDQGNLTLIPCIDKTKCRKANQMVPVSCSPGGHVQ